MWVFVLLPILMALFGIGGFCTVFVVSVMNESVNLTKGMPFISEIANYPPQSCIFAQTCNILCVLIIIIALVRFQQAADLGYKGKVNVVGFWLAFVSSIGLSITANFQGPISVVLHFFGAFVMFVLGLPYFWIQLYLTYRAEPSVDRAWVGPLRGILCFLCTLSLLGMCIFNIEYVSEGATCEWIAVLVFFGLFALFAAEFRHIDCCKLTVQRAALNTDDCPASVEKNNYVL